MSARRSRSRWITATLLACTTSQRAQSSTSLRILGTDGELHIEPAFHMEMEPHLARGETTVDLSTPQVNQMTEVLTYFTDRVLSGESISPDGDHGLEICELSRPSTRLATRDGSSVPSDGGPGRLSVAVANHRRVAARKLVWGPITRRCCRHRVARQGSAS